MRSLVAAAFVLTVSGCATAGTTPRSDQQVSGYEPNAGVVMGLQSDPALASLIAEISPARIRETDSVLVSFRADVGRVIPVGNVTSYLLPDQLDDLWAAVRSVGANGHHSLAAVFSAPRAATPQ